MRQRERADQEIELAFELLDSASEAELDRAIGHLVRAREFRAGVRVQLGHDRVEGPLQGITLGRELVERHQLGVPRGHRVLESSERRNCRFAELLGGAGPLSVEDVATIMADHGKDGRPSDQTICMHSDYWSTTACIQWCRRKGAWAQAAIWLRWPIWRWG